MKINCWGETNVETLILPSLVKDRLETKRIGKFTFARYTDGENVVIHRFGIGSTGLVEELWAYGKWSEAEHLTYIPLAQELEVNEV